MDQLVCVRGLLSHLTATGSYVCANCSIRDRPLLNDMFVIFTASFQREPRYQSIVIAGVAVVAPHVSCTRLLLESRT